MFKFSGKSALLLISIAFNSALLSARTSSADSDTCALRIGTNHYINCKKTLVWQEEEILHIGNGPGGVPVFSLKIYNPSGKLVTEIDYTGPETAMVSGYEIIRSDNATTLTETSTGRIILHLETGTDEKKNMCTINVWADIFMPDGFCFQVTPETINVPHLQYMQNSVLKNMGIAILL